MAYPLMSAVGARIAGERRLRPWNRPHKSAGLPIWTRAARPKGEGREGPSQCGLLLLIFMTAMPALAEPWVPPGDLLLRHDLQLLDDSGAMHAPLTTWPLSLDDIGRGLASIDRSELAPSAREAYARLSERLGRQSDTDPDFRLSAALAEEPRVIRGFEDTPREEAQAGGAVAWAGDRLAINLQATAVSNPSDGDSFRPDGSWVGLTLGNWLLSAGWQERWWGPGRDGSLILSTNARPTPGFAIQRNHSTAFETKWLSWIGPWSLTAFLSELDDERVINDARLFGMRVTFRPIESLEIGLSRTAQWCGEDRPCDFSAFTDLLLGNDNRGVNVDPNEEPGNQLAGIDMRWRLPRGIPVALYMQWIGEDTRRGGPEPGDWLRQAGIEHWGRIGSLQHRTHFEVADTQCRQGGFGFSEVDPDCGYEHSIYRTGYRYNGRSLGHGADGDSLVYSLGTTLIESAGHGWNLSVRRMEINRAGSAGLPHTLSATAEDRTDILVSHDRLTPIGRIRIGIGYKRLENEVSGVSSNDVESFVGWSSRW
jgi:hypothetical protein